MPKDSSANVAEKMWEIIKINVYEFYTYVQCTYIYNISLTMYVHN